MYVVYWSVMTDKNTTPPLFECRSQVFGSTEMPAAMAQLERLRVQKYQHHAPIYFVSLSSENPDCVGMQGVDVTGPDYDWKKRRV